MNPANHLTSLETFPNETVGKLKDFYDISVDVAANVLPLIMCMFISLNCCELFRCTCTTNRLGA